MKVDFMKYLFAALFLNILPQCSGEALRNNWLIRTLHYPPIVDMNGGEDTEGASFPHGVFDKLLAESVDGAGSVAYGSLLNKQEELDTYLQALARSTPESLSKYERLALLINAYNAFTLKLMLLHPQIESITKVPEEKSWDAEIWPLGGEPVSLNGIEHALIRAHFPEPRIHFALVCASVGCPKLRNEAFTGKRLLTQLEEQALHFFQQKQNLQWKADENLLLVSEIMDWYRDDFKSHHGSVLAAALFYLDDEALKSSIQAAEDKVTIGYIPYDWGINGRW